MDPCCRASTPDHFQSQFFFDFFGRILVNRTCRQSRSHRCRILELFFAYHGKSTLAQNLIGPEIMICAKNQSDVESASDNFSFLVCWDFFVRFVSPSNMILCLCSAYQGTNTLIQNLVGPEIMIWAKNQSDVESASDHFSFLACWIFLVRFVSPSIIILWLCSAYQSKSILIQNSVGPEIMI